MKILSVILLFVVCTVTLVAQPTDLPTDYLSTEFHKGRRDSLRAMLPKNSVAVVFAYPTRTFSNDVEYVYHQNPDLYYFTGYKEPHSVLLVFKDNQQSTDGSSYNEVLFIQKRDPGAEQWTGRRLGVEGAQQRSGIKMVFNGSEFHKFPVDYNKFEAILTDHLPLDAEDNPNDDADLHDLVRSFYQKATGGDQAREKRLQTSAYREITGKLREIKTDDEMDLLRKAVEISCIGQIEVMKAVHPNMSETEVQGLHEYVHKKYGAEYIGYPSIVGAGNNGCVLHYVENNKTKVGNQLILMDVGAEYHGYTADVTRTIPANGKFSEEQKIIYNLVYQAQEEAFKLCKEGTPWKEVDRVSRAVIANGLVKLGIISKPDEVKKYYPHGLGHHIGLDVHDRNSTPTLKKGMVVTVEPGIYIPENSPCDKKWWGIAVRIEDDVLIKEKDFELLSSFAPRKVEDIEKLIAQSSALDDFLLPKLKSGKKGF
jgi:Xaa-Pro aminopeptidase